MRDLRGSHSGAHHWAREFQKFVHTVRLMAPKFVIPYRLSGKLGKNDASDAAGIREAVTRPNIRFVPIKGIEQQGQLDPFGAHGVKALAQRGPGRHCAQAQRPVDKALQAKALGSLEVVRGKGQQTQVAFEDVAFGDAASLELTVVLRVDHRGQVHALEKAPN